jgi:hypothetical protein
MGLQKILTVSEGSTGELVEGLEKRLRENAHRESDTDRGPETIETSEYPTPKDAQDGPDEQNPEPI